MDNKKTLIVNYFGMGAGGIEKYIASLMRYAASNGHRVIWFTSKGNPEHAVQTGIADNPNIEKVFFADSRRKFFRKPPELNLNEAEEVVMISFTPEDYVWAEQFRYKYKCKTFYHHLILMNFFGWLTYPEDEFNLNLLSKQRAKFSNIIAHKLDNNDNIRAFAEIQLANFKERYDLRYNVSSDKLLKSISVNSPLSEEELLSKAKARKDEFVIVACSRFAFPHKGFLIGLLGVFSEIKKKYHKTKLVIIGDGERDYFNSFYDKLDDEIKTSIELKGFLEYNEMLEVYKQCHLCVAVAGALSAAASIALPALVARHDTLECETYGFYQDAESTLKSDPGFSIIPYIEKTINCTDEEYVLLGEKARERYIQLIEVEPDYIINEINKSSSPSVSKRDMRVNRRWAEISILKKYFKYL